MTERTADQMKEGNPVITEKDGELTTEMKLEIIAEIQLLKITHQGTGNVANMKEETHRRSSGASENILIQMRVFGRKGIILGLFKDIIPHTMCNILFNEYEIQMDKKIFFGCNYGPDIFV